MCPKRFSATSWTVGPGGPLHANLSTHSEGLSRSSCNRTVPTSRTLPYLAVRIHLGDSLCGGLLLASSTLTVGGTINPASMALQRQRTTKQIVTLVPKHYSISQLHPAGLPLKQTHPDDKHRPTASHVRQGRHVPQAWLRPGPGVQAEE